MDLKKEIKLSDLKPKRKPKQARRSAPAKANRRRRSRRRQELVGVEGRRIADRGRSMLYNNGGVEARPARPRAARAGHRRRRRGARHSRRSARRSTSSSTSTSCRARTSASESARTASASASSTSTASTTNKQLGNAVTFRAHEALSIPMDQAVLDYHVVGTTTSTTGAVSHRVILAAAYREPIDHFVVGLSTPRTSSSTRSMSRRSRCCARSPLVCRSTDGERHGGRRAVARPRPLDARDLRRRPSATSRACSSGAAGKLDAAIAPRARPDAEEATRSSTPSRSDDRRRDSTTQAPAGTRRRQARADQTLARELVASLQFYQAQPGSLAHRRDPGHRRNDADARARRGARAARAGPRPARRSAGRCSRVATSVVTRDDLASLAVAIGLGVER